MVLQRRSRRRRLLLFSYSYVPWYHRMFKLAESCLIIVCCFHGIQVLLILRLLGSINEIGDIIDHVIITIECIFFELV